MKQYFEPIELARFAGRNPTTKSDIQKLLADIRDELTILHRELKQIRWGKLERRLIGHRISLCIKLAKQVKWSLHRLDHHDTSDFMAKIQRAKSVNIERILPFPVKNNRTDCPFHTGGSKGSMSIRDNFAWCYRCQDGWDIIDCVRKIQGCGFRDAVERLQSF